MCAERRLEMSTFTCASGERAESAAQRQSRKGEMTGLLGVCVSACVRGELR